MPGNELFLYATVVKHESDRYNHPMAIKGTTYNFEIDLADSDRNLFEQLKVTISMHSSETLPSLVTRVIAYCLEYSERLMFSKGLDQPEEPALWEHSLDNRVIKWIEVGNPSGEKLHKASKTAEKVSIYTYRTPAILLENLKNKDIYRRSKIELFSLSEQFITKLVNTIEKRNCLSLAVMEHHLYLEINGHTLDSVITAHAL